MIADPITTETDSAPRLFELAREIRLYQESQTPRMSDNALLARFPGLGSTKTFKKLREGSTEQLEAAEWLPRYEGVMAQIEAEADSREEVIYDDLSFTDEIYQTTLRLLQQRGLNRLLVIEGGSGSGKTRALASVARRLPGGVVLVEAHEGWNSPWTAAGDILLALGAVKKTEELPNGFAERQSLLIQKLQARRLVEIDEAQHMGARTLNMLKSLLNQTPSYFTIAALDTLWKKLTTGAWEEAKQLLLNRMFARIKIGAPSARDAERFMSRRITLEGDTVPALKQIIIVARDHGGMAFLRNVAARCHALGVDKADAATLLEAAKHVRSQVEGR